MIDLSQWFDAANKGQRTTYHSGPKLSLTPAVRAARRLYDAGMIDLVQRRAPGGEFDYIAIKRFRQAQIERHNTFAAMEG